MPVPDKADRAINYLLSTIKDLSKSKSKFWKDYFTRFIDLIFNLYFKNSQEALFLKLIGWFKQPSNSETFLLAFMDNFGKKLVDYVKIEQPEEKRVLTFVIHLNTALLQKKEFSR